MPTKSSQPNKPKQGLSPNHVSHVKAALRSAKSSRGFHPLVVPPMSDSDQDDQMIPASSGEYIIPKEVVARKGTQFFDNIVKKTLEEVMPSSQASPAARPAAASAADMGGTGTPQTGYRWGGEVRERGDSNFGGGFWSRFRTPMAMTGYQDAVDPHPNFWGPNQGGRPGGPQVFINREPPGGFTRDPNVDRIVDNPVANNFLNNWNSFGYTPASGFAPGGPTMLPTFWNNYPGVGMVPMAVPPGGWSNDGGSPYQKMSRHTPMPKPD